MLAPFPLKEDTLCRYVAHLSTEHLKHCTIKSYLSALRFVQIQQGLGDPFQQTSMPLLEYVLAGIKRTQARSSAPPKPRLPITPQLLGKLQQQWVLKPPTQEGLMLWAAACTGFFGFLRSGEFTVPSPGAYNKEVHLDLEDLAIDSHASPSMIRVHIKQSKTDPFRKGADIYLGATGTTICTVQALWQYLAVRGPTPGPLFRLESGAPLTRATLVNSLQQALRNAGVDAAAFNGHSFRIGAATTAAKCGIEDSLIQTLGRWKSTAYLHYIKLPREQLAAISPQLIRRSTEQ